VLFMAIMPASRLSKATAPALFGTPAGFAVTVNTILMDAAVTYSATADFNGDGKPDLLVGEAGPLQILLGNGDRTFKLSRQ
jgi:hypothetical protein